MGGKVQCLSGSIPNDMATDIVDHVRVARGRGRNGDRLVSHELSSFRTEPPSQSSTAVSFANK